MRIPKRLIKRVADEMLRENMKITQMDVHAEIEKILGRQLTHGEKIRVTKILRNEYIVNKEVRDKENGQRIYFFM